MVFERSGTEDAVTAGGVVEATGAPGAEAEEAEGAEAESVVAAPADGAGEKKAQVLVTAVW
jgi:hypothetical protein